VRKSPCVLSAVLTALTWTGWATANDGPVATAIGDIHTVAYTGRLEALEREVAELQKRLASGDKHGCQEPACAECCGTHNWYAGVDMTLLQPYFGALSFGPVPGPPGSG